MASDDDHVRLRVVVDGGRIAQASTTRLDADGLERLVEGTHRGRPPAARPIPTYPGLAAPGDRWPTSTTSTARHGGRSTRRPRRGRRRLRGRRPDLESAGYCSTDADTHVLCSTTGIAVRQPVDDGPGRRHPPGCRRSTARRPTATARSPRSACADLDGRRVGDDRRRQGHAAARTRSSSTPGTLRGGARGQGRRRHAAVPGLARLQRQGLRRGHELRPPRRAAVRRAHRPLGRRHRPACRSVARTTPRARRSAASTSCGPASPSGSPTTGAARRWPASSPPGTPSASESFGGYPGDLFLGGGDQPLEELDRRRRAGPAGHRLLVQPDPRSEDAGRHRAHPQRALPDRARRGHRPGAEPALHPVGGRQRWPPATSSGSATTPSSSSNEGGIVHVPSLRLASWAFTGNAQG